MNDEELKKAFSKESKGGNRSEFRKEIKRGLITLTTDNEPYVVRIGSEEDFLELLGVIRSGYLAERMLITFPDGFTRTLNEQSIEGMANTVTSKYEDEYYKNELKSQISRGENFTISKVANMDYSKSREGGSFVKYLHKTDLDLERYQIYKRFNKKNYVNNCLYVALSNYGISEEKLNMMKSCVKNRKVFKVDLKKIAEKIGITIKLREYIKGSKKTRLITYGTKGEICNVALFENHYFTYEKISIFLDGVRFKTSLGLIRFLFENKEKYFKPINNVHLSSLGYNNDEISSLEFDRDVIEEYNRECKKKKSKSESKIKRIYFADFECYVDDNDRHKPYQVGFASEDKDDYVCYNYVKDVDLSRKMLDHMCRVNSCNEVEGTIVIYFHNAKYDVSVMHHDLMFNMEVLTQNEFFYRLTFDYYYKGKKYHFEIRDSLKHLNYPISEFPEIFDLCDEYQRKEIIPYNFYTLSNVKKRLCKIEDAVACLKKYKYDCTKDDIDKFRENITNWDLNHGENYDIIEYSQIYNKLDVMILKEGFKKWREQVKEFTGLNIYKILTSASLSQEYFESKGAYKNAYKLNQHVRKFIHKTVYGGRCMTNRHKKYLLNVIMQDLDAVSLYPSAIYRLKELGGILQGIPKIIESRFIKLVNKESDYKKKMELFDKFDGYFVEVKITSLKDRQFPLLPLKEGDKLIYDNKAIINKIVSVGKIQLEDLVEFGDCKFELIRGYYFDEGRDDTICKVIEELFYKRLSYKKAYNALQEVVKLLMNSAYGKTIQKETETTSKILKNKEVRKGDKLINKYESYVSNNYDRIKTINKLGESDYYKVETYVNVDDHYGMPHIGSEILAMSKRIMNEVMCLAEDNGIMIYYQDTDSMHIEEKDVERLAELFKLKYGRELLGDNMGQFHCDFESSKLKECLKPLEKKLKHQIPFNEEEKEKYAKLKKRKSNIHSSLTILLGRKSYLDVLEIGENEIDLHIRMKGIPKESINKHVNKKEFTCEDLYRDLYSGNKHRFDLTCDQQKPKFQNRNFIVETKLKFDRVVQFT